MRLTAFLAASLFLSPARAEDVPPVGPAKAVSCRKIGAAVPRPAVNNTPFSGDDDFRRDMMRAADRWEVFAGAGVDMLVEPGYMADAAVEAFCAEVVEARAAVPAVLGRAEKVRGRFTLYVFDSGPMSESDVPGVAAGQPGIMLRFVKEGESPLFHEFTHLLGGYGSQSLSEGLADYVQNRIRPGKASGFKPAGLNPHEKALFAAGKLGKAYQGAVGAPDKTLWQVVEAADGVDLGGASPRHLFYYGSWSFVDYLVGLKGLPAFLAVHDAGGTEASYRTAYGKSADALRRDWAKALPGLSAAWR